MRAAVFATALGILAQGGRRAPVRSQGARGLARRDRFPSWRERAGDPGWSHAAERPLEPAGAPPPAISAISRRATVRFSTAQLTVADSLTGRAGILRGDRRGAAGRRWAGSLAWDSSLQRPRRTRQR